MRIFSRRAAEHADRAALAAHLRRSNERQAELETLRFLLTTIKKRHTWDRIKCTIATAIPAFWIVMISLRAYLPAWLHPLLQGVPAIWTIAVSLAIAGFQWRNLRLPTTRHPVDSGDVRTGAGEGRSAIADHPERCPSNQQAERILPKP